MINHGKIKKGSYEEGYKTGFKRGYLKCKKDIMKKYDLINIDKMTSDVYKEYRNKQQKEGS